MDEQVTEAIELATQALENPTDALDDVELETVIGVDYVPVIYEVGNGIASTIIWCTFLIVGVLVAFKIMEVRR